MTDLGDSRHEAAVTAAEVLDKMSDEAIEAHQRAAEAAAEYGLLLGRSGLRPDVVLGQMLLAVSVAFTHRVMPYYRPMPGSNGGSSS